MKVTSTENVESAEVLDGVNLAQLVVGDQMNIQHFEIQPDVYVEEHEHQEQAGFIFSGELLWVVDGEEHLTEAGDTYIIPGDTLHSAENTGDEPAVGIELFSPPRPNPPWAE